MVVDSIWHRKAMPCPEWIATDGAPERCTSTRRPETDGGR